MTRVHQAGSVTFGGGLLAIALRGREMDWFGLLTSARRLATAQDPWVSASEASEYGLDLLTVAETDGLSDQQRQILLMHGEMWLVRPRWERSELISLLGKQLDTYRLFGLPDRVHSQLADVIQELRAIAS